MKTILTIAVIALLAGSSARADKEFAYDKKDSFDGAAVTSITLDMDQGAIAIVKSRNSNIEVFYKNVVLAAKQSEADDINQDYKYSAQTEGGRLKIAVETPRHGRHGKGIVERIIEGDWNQEGSYPMVKLSIPDGKAVEIRSASSDIDVSALTVDLDIESASSDITLEDTQGKFGCDIASGDVNITGHKGPIAVDGKSSDIRIIDAEGSVDARTASGDVIIEKVKGPVEASTASGDARLSDIDGDADVAVTSGDVAVEGCSGSVRAESVSGDVRLSALSAGEGDFEVQSISGDVRMEVSRDFKGEVTLRSASGDVNSRLLGKVTYEDDDESGPRSAMRGTVGQGKGRLHVASTSGDITVDGY